MHSVKVIFVLVTFAALSVQVHADEATVSTKLKVSVYYEVLCPDSVRFFVYQLYPTYEKIGDLLELDLIPYGKAIQNKQSNGHWKFECQHGPMECRGNMIQACGLNQTLSTDVKMKFFYCLMKSSNPASTKTVQKCTKNTDVKYTSIANCVNNQLGEDLLAHYGDMTHAADPKISFVPTIVFNDAYSDDLQNKALRDLLKTSCELLPKEKQPADCRISD